MNRNRRRLLRAAGLAPLSLCLPARAQTEPAADFERVLRRLQAAALAETDATGAERWLREQTASGQWSDVDYADRSTAYWKPIAHLQRTRVIAAAYAAPSHPLAHSPRAREAVRAALVAWFERQPASEGWWQNTIGLQIPLMQVLVLMRDDLPPDLRDRAIGLLNSPDQMPRDHATGQNLVWYAHQQLVRGALTADGGDLTAASRRMQAGLVIGSGEGIQADYSFHQHGAQLYSGGYGLAFLLDGARAAALLADTPWTFTDQQLTLLADYALQGIAPLVRGPWLDWGARGREFTRHEKIPRPQLLREGAVILWPLVPARGKPLARLAEALAEGRLDPAPDGNRVYWRSDFMVHRRTRGYISVKMVSARTVGTESGNGENVLGFWLPFGVTYIVRRGDEYDGLPPVWEWSALPGLTAPAQVPRLAGYQRHAERFVGGLSDGQSGLAAMRLNKLATRARKAWFLHADMMLALGTDIASEHPLAVRTTLNQTRWVGAVHTGQGELPARDGELRLSGSRWVWHDHVTYLLLDGPEWSVRRELRTFGANPVNPGLGAKTGQARVFTLDMDHGVRPAGSRYAYGVWLGAAAPEGVAAAPAVTILRNDAALQAVRFDADGLVQAVFHAGGTLSLDAQLAVTMDGPGLLMLRPAAGGGWRVHGADPSGDRRVLRVRLHDAADRSAEVALQLPPLDGPVAPQADALLRPA